MFYITIIRLTLSLVSIGAFVESAKILAIFPYPGPSQYIVVQPLFKALAVRGHELTVLSHHPQKNKLRNYRDIKLEYPNYYDDFVKPFMRLQDSPDLTELWFSFLRNVSLFAFDNKNVQNLLQSKHEHFDLVIAEALHIEALYAFAAHFNAPLIGVSSFGTDPTIDSLIGNTSPVSYLPLATTALTDRMDFWQRLENLKIIITEWMHLRQHHMPTQEMLYKKYFPHLKQSLSEIAKNFSLIFVNQHFSISFPRPYVPAMIEVGGMHINQKVTPLPQDIAAFINNASHGVIYFALGSNVKSQDFPKDRLKAILNVFSRLKERVIWKFENSSIPELPDNVLIRSWLPQSDILAQPNVKLFITHAGLLSTMEAIHYAKPLVCIPVFFDQFFNLERIKLAGFGVGIDYHTFDETDLMSAIQEVMGNPKYKNVVRDISRRYHDQPMKPLDKAIYWTEYVLRHNGARHMRVAGQDLSFIAYHSLDTWSYIICIWVLLPSILIILAIKFLLSSLKIIFKSHEEISSVKKSLFHSPHSAVLPCN